MKYKFGYGEEGAVEIPEMDAFRAELDAVFKKYGVTFRHESYSDDWGCSSMKLAPYTSHHWDDLFGDDLENAVEGGVPWLDEARTLYAAKQSARFQAERKSEAERKAAEAKARADALVTNGVLLEGKRYKLVPDE